MEPAGSTQALGELRVGGVKSPNKVSGALTRRSQAAIGYIGSGQTTTQECRIGEVIITDGRPTTGEDETIMSYLESKWNLYN